MEGNQTRFNECSDSDIKKLVPLAFFTIPAPCTGFVKDIAKHKTRGLFQVITWSAWCKITDEISSVICTSTI